METKICSDCKKELPISKFTFRQDSQTYRNKCHKCAYQQNKKSIKKYQKKNPDKVIKSTLNWRKKNKKKRNAQSMLQRYVKIGKIIKPVICENCKLKKDLQGHHEDYNKPLDVNWLCAECHKNKHSGGE